jgi:hypothetical protein
MPLPTDSGALFDLLAADSTLLALLGTYSFRDGATGRALSRLWPNEPREQSTRCSGVEVAVARIPAKAGRLLWSGEAMAAAVFRIYVTQWAVPQQTPALPHNLDAVVDRIMVLLDGQAESTPAGLPDGLTGLGQVVIRYAAVETILKPAAATYLEN